MTWLKVNPVRDDPVRYQEEEEEEEDADSLLF